MRVADLVPGGPVTILAVQPVGAVALKVTYEYGGGQTGQCLVYTSELSALKGELLPRTPLRFLLADDPGAGKTIMAGLYIKELLLRGDVVRCLVVAPGGLVEQWQKEELLRFDGTALFPERRASTVPYPLSPGEQRLYDEVTAYVRGEWNRVDALRQAGEGGRGNTVGFALTVLQRRLASSPEAIWRSLERRRKRLESRRQEMVYRPPPDPLTNRRFVRLIAGTGSDQLDTTLEDLDGRYLGLALPYEDSFGQIVDSTLIVEAGRARAQRDLEITERQAEEARRQGVEVKVVAPGVTHLLKGGGSESVGQDDRGPSPQRPRRFFGVYRVDPNPLRRMKLLTDLDREVLQHLTADPGVELAISVEITAVQASGFSEDRVRTVRENARALRFEQAEFEDE